MMTEHTTEVVICRLVVTPVNDAPEWVTSVSIHVVEGGSVVMSPLVLNTSDPDTTLDKIEFTVAEAPVHGEFQLVADGTSVSSFTAADVLEGTRVAYVHSGSEFVGDSVVLSTMDRVEGTQYKNISLLFVVESVDDVATVDVVGQIEVLEGGSRVIDSSVMNVSDPDTTHANLVFLVTAEPTNGHIAVR